MTTKFKGIALTIIAVVLALYVPSLSYAGINEVQKSLKKDKVISSSKTAKSKPNNSLISKKSLENTNNEFKALFIKPSKKVVKTVSSPLRISEPMRIKDDGEGESVPSLNIPDPDSFNLPKVKSEDELAGQDKLKDYYRLMASGDTLPPFGSFCVKYSEFPYLCAIARYYDFEYKLYKLSQNNDNIYKGMEEYDIGLQAVGIYSKYTNDKICNEVVEKINDKLKKIDDNDQNLQKEISAFNTRLETFKKNIDKMQEDFKNNVYEGPLTEGSFYYIVNAYRDLIRLGYGGIFKTHFFMKDYQGAKDRFDSLIKYYDELPETFNIRYQMPPDPANPEAKPEIKTITVKIDKKVAASLGDNSYDLNEDLRTTIKDEYLTNAFRYLTTADNGEEIYKEIKPLVNNYGSSWMKKERKIDKLYFTRQEKTEICADEPLNVNELVTLRAEASNYFNSSSLYPFTINVESSCSKKSKPILLKRDFFYGDYYGAFLPNEDDKSKDLINVDKSNKGLVNSIFLLDGSERWLQERSDVIGNPFSYILKAAFFNNNYLGKAVARKKSTDSIDSLVINEKVIGSMGYEMISAKIDNEIESHTFISNPADWMIFEGHHNGSREGEGLGISNDDGSNTYFPIENISFSNTSKTNFVMFLACAAFYIPVYSKENITDETISEIKVSNGAVWKRKFGNNITMLGYNNYTTSFPSPLVIDLFLYLAGSAQSYPFNVYPYNNDYKNSVIQKWINLHIQYYKAQILNIINDPEFSNLSYDGIKKFVLKYNVVLGACAINGSDYHYIRFKSGIVINNNANSYDIKYFNTNPKPEFMDIKDYWR